MRVLGRGGLFLAVAIFILMLPGGFHAALAGPGTDRPGQSPDGAPRGIVLEGCTIPGLTVSNAGTRLLATGNTAVGPVTLRAGATLVEQGLTGGGFGAVLVSEAAPAGTRVVLSGDFDRVTVRAGDTRLDIAGGVVRNLTLDAAASVAGAGRVGTAHINADGVVMAQTPQNVRLGAGITAMVGGVQVGGPARSSKRSSAGRDEEPGAEDPGEGDPGEGDPGEDPGGDDDESPDPGEGDPGVEEPRPITLNIGEITELLRPVLGEKPVEVIDVQGAPYSGTVSWGGPDLRNGRFEVDMKYTATVTPTAKKGYTLDGARVDASTVTGATYTYDADAGVITLSYPETPGFAGGNGLKDNPWEITNAWQLDRVRHHLDGHFKLKNDIDLTNFLDECDDEAGWEPIGFNKRQFFTGELDGNGCAIDGLWSKRPSRQNVGLFGYVVGGCIRGLSVNADICGGNHTGGLVGYHDSGTISNCTVTGVVNGGDQTGGLVGFNGGTISGSHNAAEIHGAQNTGGVAGRNTKIIENCYNAGNVSGIEHIGGVVGYNVGTGKIANVYNIGPITGNSVGALLAHNVQGGSIQNSYWDKEASGCPTSSGGEGKSTKEMKNRDTYVGWDFDKVWGIDENINNGYPYLQWQTGTADN